MPHYGNKQSPNGVIFYRLNEHWFAQYVFILVILKGISDFVNLALFGIWRVESIFPREQRVFFFMV